MARSSAALARAPFKRVTVHTWLAKGIMECTLECGHIRIVTKAFHLTHQQCVECDVPGLVVKHLPV